MTLSSIRRQSGKSPSLSSSSSSSLASLSSFLDGSSSPATPFQYSGVPFSWEQFPGIPKKHKSDTNHTDSSHECLLPLPPSGYNSSSFRKDMSTAPAVIKKYTISGDPFFAAFVECSKDEELMVMKGSKIRSSNGFGSLYTSCFRACDVAGSIVYLPRSRPAGYFLR